jgi:hypothetical protein
VVAVAQPVQPFAVARDCPFQRAVAAAAQVVWRTKTTLRLSQARHMQLWLARVALQVLVQ